MGEGLPNGVILLIFQVFWFWCCISLMQERGGDEAVNVFEMESCFEWGLDVVVKVLIHSV